MSEAPALLLLGHGSHVHGRSAQPIHDAAARLRATGAHPEVRVAFWKEEPELRYAFLLVERPRVVAVPIFTSVGYFTEGVLPRELGLDPPLSTLTRLGGARGGGRAAPSDSERFSGNVEEEADRLRVRYTRPVGTHPRMAAVVRERARDLTRDRGIDPAGSTLVVLGHGTERHPESGGVVHRLTGRLAEDSGFGSVTCAFLDEDPRMVPVLEGLETTHAVVVPFFIAKGWHVGTTIPRDLGLEEGRARIGDTKVHYADPVGTHPALTGVIDELVEEAMAAGWGAEPDAGEAREPLPARARRRFLAWIDGAGPDGRIFLQTHVRRREPGRYEVRHVEDRGRPAVELERTDDPHRALDFARRTAGGEHRPLRTAPDLRAGWLLEDLSGDGLWEAYAHLYPTTPVHWYLEREEALPRTSFRAAAGRQTGIYAPVSELTDAEVERTVASCCVDTRCLRRVRWPLREDGSVPNAADGALDERAGTDAPDEDAAVPCPEPCSLFLTRARELLDGHT